MDEHEVLVKMTQPQEMSRKGTSNEINYQDQTAPSRVLPQSPMRLLKRKKRGSKLQVKSKLFF